jgi:hypothetical protein
MVVLAASIVSKNGKGACLAHGRCISGAGGGDHSALTGPRSCPAALVSRQYMDMSRIRIEGLLAAFPKLVGTGKQHTFVETENVRYVYQPLEVSPDRQPARSVGFAAHAERCLPGRRACTCCW